MLKTTISSLKKDGVKNQTCSSTNWEHSLFKNSHLWIHPPHDPQSPRLAIYWQLRSQRKGCTRLYQLYSWEPNCPRSERTDYGTSTQNNTCQQKRRATYKCNIMDERISRALWQGQEARLKPTCHRSPLTGQDFSDRKQIVAARGWDGERSDHKRAARGSPSGDRTALDILTVVITQLYVLVNFHRLAHQKD